jgi:ABC-2 type transport system permease protein/lipopolysaccharide transport system permease protein
VVDGLRLFDPKDLPDSPPADQFYRHPFSFLRSIREAWGYRDVVFALAERDVRVSYKQAALGMAWALLSPVLQIVIFTLIFSKVKAFQVTGIPYALYAYTGILCWSYFSGAFSSGGTAMIGNIALLQKTQFSRECFPLSQMLEQSLYTTIGLLPLGILMAYLGFAPKIEVLWFPVFVAIEVVFTAGVVLGMCALVVYVRDLVQVMSIVTQLGLFATPIIWPLDKISKITWGPFHHVDFRPYYCAFNPLAAVIDDIRRTLLQGLQPAWGLTGIAAISACLYFFFGYRIFKKLEIGFADIS